MNHNRRNYTTKIVARALLVRYRPICPTAIKTALSKRISTGSPYPYPPNIHMKSMCRAVCGVAAMTLSWYKYIVQSLAHVLFHTWVSRVTGFSLLDHMLILSTGQRLDAYTANIKLTPSNANRMKKSESLHGSCAKIHGSVVWAAPVKKIDTIPRSY